MLKCEMCIFIETLIKVEMQNIFIGTVLIKPQKLINIFGGWRVKKSSQQLIVSTIQYLQHNSYTFFSNLVFCLFSSKVVAAVKNVKLTCQLFQENISNILL